MMVFQTGKVNKGFEKVLMNNIHVILVKHKEMMDYFNIISKIKFVHILTPTSEPTTALIINPTPSPTPDRS